MMRRGAGPAIRRAKAFALVVAAACAPPAPAPAPQPSVASPPSAVVDPLDAPWFTEPAAGTIAQALHVDAELESRVDTLVRHDTLRSVLVAQWSRVSGDGAVRLSGLLTDFRVSGDSAEPAPVTGLLLPIPFNAVEGLGAAPARLLRPEPTGCGLDAVVAQGLRELFLQLPRRLETGTTWGDSARYTICRDSIPLQVSSVRAFRILGAERRGQELLVRVERSSRVEMRGEGTQFGETLSISATGEGRATLLVRLRGVAVVEGSGENVLRMTMRGRRRTQELTQHSRITISAP